MRLIALAALGIFLTGTPLRAEPVTPVEVWELFAKTCDAALAEPEDTAKLTEISGATQAQVASTPDRWGTQGILVMEDLDTGGSGSFLTVNYSVVRQDDGIAGFCTLQLLRPDEGALEGMVEVFDARRGELVPDSTRHGGAIGAGGEEGQWIAWSAPGVPPDTVSLRSFAPVTILTLNRYTVKGAN